MRNIGRGECYGNQTFRKLSTFSYNRPAVRGTPPTHMPCGPNNQLVVLRWTNEWLPMAGTAA